MKKQPPVKCPRCRKKTTGKLYQVGSNRLCEKCSKAKKVVEYASGREDGIYRVR